MPPQGARYRKPAATHDHWHSTADDEGRPYRFATADKLLLDFEADAAQPSVESAEVLLRLLTPDNRRLLRTIRDAKPQSVAELARLTNRAEPNLPRTLGKLEAFGLVAMHTINRRRVPTVMVDTLRVEIDPFAMADRIEAQPALVWIDRHPPRVAIVTFPGSPRSTGPRCRRMSAGTTRIQADAWANGLQPAKLAPTNPAKETECQQPASPSISAARLPTSRWSTRAAAPPSSC